MKQKVQRQRQKKEPVGEAKKPREVRLYVEAINSVDCVTVVMETIFSGLLFYQPESHACQCFVRLINKSYPIFRENNELYSISCEK